VTDERILTIPEAAEFARVDEKTIKRWIDQGLRHMITAKSVGLRGPRKIIIRQSQLIAFIEAHEHHGPRHAPAKVHDEVHDGVQDRPQPVKARAAAAREWKGLR
jgi:hypothetical protein